MIRLLFVTLLLSCNTTLYAQNNFPGTYLFDEAPTAIFAQTVVHDTIVCCGVVFKEGDTINYQQGLFVAFIDSCGNTIRVKKYFDPNGRDIFLNLTNKIIHTKDGGYCFVGAAGPTYFLLKTNNLGDVEFVQDVPVFQDFDAISLLTVHEIGNAYYSIGFGDNSNPYRDDMLMVKFDRQGNLLNSWRFNTPESCEYFQDAVTFNEHIVVSATQTNLCTSGKFQSRTRIFEVDTSGNVIWNWLADSTNLRRGAGFGLKPTPDGGWVYAGPYVDTLINTSFQYYKLFVTKLDANRQHVWTKVIGYPDNDYNTLKDITIDADGNYIVTGQYVIGYADFPNPYLSGCAIIIKITPSGEILWTSIVKAFEETPTNRFLMYTYNINQLSSGNFIIGGYLYRYIDNIPQNEGWLAKVSPSGEVLDEPNPLCGFVSAHHPPASKPGILCYPNPAQDVVQLRWDQANMPPTPFQFAVYDQLGRAVFTKDIEPFSDHSTIDTKDWPNGMYSYRMITGGSIGFSGNFIIVKAP